MVKNMSARDTVYLNHIFVASLVEHFVEQFVDKARDKGCDKDWVAGNRLH